MICVSVITNSFVLPKSAKLKIYEWKKGEDRAYYSKSHIQWITEHNMDTRVLGPNKPDHHRYMIVSVPTKALDIQHHVSWFHFCFVLVQWFKIWVSWYCWHSLFKLSFHKLSIV